MKNAMSVVQVATLLIALVMVNTFSMAQESKLEISVEDLNRVSEAEAALKDLLQTELEGGNPLLQGRQNIVMTGRQAVMSGLEKNLALRKGYLDDDVAAAILEQAKAVFDPVLTLSLDYNRTQVNTRIENAPRFQSATTVNNDGDNVLAIQEDLDPRAPVVVFSEAREEGFEDARIVASQEPITGADESYTLGAGLDQSLPWGGSFRISYNAINQDTFFINNPQLFSGSADPPLNLIGFGSYKRPWVSELAAGMQMPIPGTRGYGDFSDQALGEQRALLGRESSAFATRELVNQTLREVDTAWWDLVESALAIQVVRESRVAAEALLDSTQRLFRGRSANNYDLSQAELSVASNRRQEQSAWSAYVAASDRLSNLLDLNANGIIIPEGFAQSLGLEEELPPSSGEVILEHPDYLATSAQNDIASLDEKAGLQGTRLDLSFDAELRLRQSNQVFGYKSFADSLGSVFDPDVTTTSLGLSYSRPLGNRSALAVSDESAARSRQSSLNLDAKRLELRAGLESANAALEGALISTAYLAEASRLAESGYEKALAQQRNRQVREYELAGQHAQLLSARLSYISSLVSVQRARTAVLDARGILHSHYAAQQASHPIEKARLALLKGTGAFDLFLPGGKQK